MSIYTIGGFFYIPHSEHKPGALASEDLHALLNNLRAHISGNVLADGHPITIGMEIAIALAGYDGSLFVEPDIAGTSLHSLVLRFNYHTFRERDLHGTQLLLDAWIALCEQINARYATFGKPDPDEMANQRIHIGHLVEQGNIRELITQYPEPWQYFSQALVVRLSELTLSQMPPPAEERKEYRLPTGSRCFVYPEISDYLTYNPVGYADFLLYYLRSATSVAGVTQIITTLTNADQAYQHDRQQWIANLGFDRVPLPPPDDRLDLFEHIHTLWATAYRRTGLQGVNQTFAFLKSDGRKGTVLVPIIAEQGREWVLYSKDALLDAQDPRWADPQQGALTRVKELLAAAQQNPVAGIPPHIVLVCWQGASAAIRSLLESLGVSLEIPPVATPILE